MRKPYPVRKFQTLPKNRLLVGYELEFTSKVLDRQYGGSDRLKSAVIPMINGKLGEDGGCYELRTRPILGDQAASTLKWALQFLRDCQAVTKLNDGLHINISCAVKEFQPYLNPVSLWVHSRPRYWATVFGRANHCYCKLPKRDLPIVVSEFLGDGLSKQGNSAINFEHYRPLSAPVRSRIEFRYPGGKNYHLREKMLLNCLSEILEATRRSFIR